MSNLLCGVVPEMADNLEAWHAFSAPLEGRVYSMYCDIKGLVTCGVGNLIDPMSLALELPWRIHDTGTTPAPDDAELASEAQVIAAWQDIKAHKDKLKKMHFKFAGLRNNLRLSERDVDDLVMRKLFEFEDFMEKHHFPGWRDFPADAQLGICSMAWACGPGFPAIFKNFTGFANKNEWANASLCAKIKEAGNPGVVPRNRENRKCFANAAIVVAHGMDRDVLYWPNEPVPPPEQPPGAPLGPSIEDDQPELTPLEVASNDSEDAV